VASAAPPAAPSNLKGVSDNDLRKVVFSWDDNSDDEAGFNLQVFNDGSWIEPWGPIPPDGNSFEANGPFNIPPGSDWRVRSFNAAEEVSEWSDILTAFTFNGRVDVTGFHRCQIGDPLSFPVTIAGFTDPVVGVAPLPAGVTFDAASNTISGTPSEGGFLAVTITAQDGVNVRKGSIGLAVIDPPVVTAPIAPSGAAGSGQDIDLSNLFDDPDTETTAVIKTSLGDVPLTLFDSSAPITSDNFKGYMDRGDWDNTIIHRSISNFIIQGGWLHPEGDKDFSLVPSAGFIDDEYDDSRPNTGSTFAMAKNDPNTSSTNWFVSLKDNAQNLDFQAGGFAAFARVIGDGMEVMGAIEQLQTGTYRNVTLDGDGFSLSDLPLTEITAESPLDSELVVVSSIERIDPLAFELVGNSNPDAVAASLDGGILSLSFSASESVPGGESMITLAATDLDGARSEYTFPATSIIDYATWAGLFQGGDALDHSDGGLMNDLQEYAFGGDPTDAADDSAIAPSLSEVEIEGEPYDALVFYLRKYSSDLIYSVETSPDVSNWSELWTSADGIEAELVANVEDAGSFWILTVRYPESGGPAGGRLFFRTVVELEPDAQ
jgi:peptidyl-prolyl cis-trans isomerase A (cyclophilin A)